MRFTQITLLYYLRVVASERSLGRGSCRDGYQYFFDHFLLLQLLSFHPTAAAEAGKSYMSEDTQSHNRRSVHTRTFR